MEEAVGAAVSRRIRAPCNATVLGWCTPSGLLCEEPAGRPAGGAGGGGRRGLLDDGEGVAHLVLRLRDGGPLTAAVAGFMNGTGTSAFFPAVMARLAMLGVRATSVYWRRPPRHCPTEAAAPQCNATDVRARVRASAFAFGFALGDVPDFDMDRDGWGGGVWGGGMGGGRRWWWWVGVLQGVGH